MAGCVFVPLLVLWGVAGWRAPPTRPHRDVVTTQGAVRGYLVGGNTPYYAYLGLPYAHPPTGHHRYKAPKPPPSWDGIFEATHRIRCPQANANGDENCLVLNIFSLGDAFALPVLVLVHGGAFHSGWGTHNPPMQLLEKGFVLVSFNYRIGALGFLCLHIPDAPGNVGLKDQIAAFYWINKNIEKFGGNPQDVTVYATGSGAAAIQILLLSRVAEGLFQKVIMEAGSALAPTSVGYDPLLVALSAAKQLGYGEKDDSKKLYQFYLTLPIKELIMIADMFSPCVENVSHSSYSLLDLDPVQILKGGNFHKVPMIIVYTDSVGTSMIKNDIEKFKEAPGNFEILLPSNLDFGSVEVKKKLGGIVKAFYFGDDPLGRNVIENYGDYIQDLLNEYPVVKFAMLYATRNTQSIFLMKIIIEALGMETMACSEKGTLLTYLYHTEDENGDEDINKKLITLWMNFIQMSDPTPLSTTLLPVVWESIDSKQDISSVSTLHFPSMRMGPPPFNQRLLFWENIYNRFYKSHHIKKADNEDVHDD